ncbi:MAG: hypothetical protein JW881_21045 [Spirochaetales bacterium]|nr:hypothetical protein [Spirochaetales bacterium]
MNQVLLYDAIHASNKAGIENDERYRSESAHATFCRFTSPLRDPAGLLRYIEKHRSYALGTETVAVIELVEHDWYNRSSAKRIIKQYVLVG